jgi:hypothetical protein
LHPGRVEVGLVEAVGERVRVELAHVVLVAPQDIVIDGLY